MRFVSFLVSVARACRSEQAAFATCRRLAPDRSLTLTTQFWAEDTDGHRVDVVDELAGNACVIATRTAAAPAPNRLLSLDLPVPPLVIPGAHRLHLNVDGERVTSAPIGVTVREVPRRGQRSRYKGRGTLTALHDRPVAPMAAGEEWEGWPRAAFSSPEAFTRGDFGIEGGHLFHGELFPMQRLISSNGTVSGLWIAACFRGFAREEEGPHLFTVADIGPGGSSEVVGVKYFDVSGPCVTLRLDLDPIGRTGAHMLGLAIDGRSAGEMSVDI
jgi:hypothetical protein